MQTNFSPIQLADSGTAVAARAIRNCVHCGLCNATCPTYMLLGDELDSPRGRIYLMKDMLENERRPTAEVVKHIDRCLSCLACMTTCPSSVNYMQLVDHARAYIEARYRRPLVQRFYRALLAGVLPYPRRLRAALFLARPLRGMRPALERRSSLAPLAAMLALVPPAAARAAPTVRCAASMAAQRGRVLLLQGCVEPVLQPQVRAATVRLLQRLGFRVEFANGEACCGALVQHLGREESARDAARRNIDAWTPLLPNLDAIVITTSGCGTSVKNYGWMLRDDPLYAARAERVALLAKDVSEVLDPAMMTNNTAMHEFTVAYHAACSLQHGQRIGAAPVNLLTAAGFTVKTPVESSVCCGSAGTYNLLQPAIAAQLGARKASHLQQLQPDVIATGNVGCATQIAQRSRVPVVHTVELLEWALGGARPAALRSSATLASSP